MIPYHQNIFPQRPLEKLSQALPGPSQVVSLPIFTSRTYPNHLLKAKPINLLNRFFASYFTHHVCSSSNSIHLSLCMPPTCFFYTLTSITCDEQEVFQLLSMHKTNTATGPDGISGHMLKNLAISIYQSLIHLLNLSLSQEKVPSHGMENVKHNCKELSQCSNFCPISLLSLLSKLLNSTAFNQFADIIPFKFQFGKHYFWKVSVTYC